MSTKEKQVLNRRVWLRSVKSDAPHSAIHSSVTKSYRKDGTLFCVGGDIFFTDCSNTSNYSFWIHNYSDKGGIPKRRIVRNRKVINTLREEVNTFCDVI